jgi:hypothetical protein
MAITTWTDEERRVREDMRVRAARGAGTLDDVASSDWADRIDKTRLDMSDTVLCVVGQIDGTSPWLTPEGASVTRHWRDDYEYRVYPPELGFELSVDDKATEIGTTELYSHLRDAWLYEIERRTGDMQ